MDWMERAYCKDAGGTGNLWFSHSQLDQAEARRKCMVHCPVRGACEAFVLTFGINQPEGVWAGMGTTERTRLVRKRQASARRARKAQEAQQCT